MLARLMTALVFAGMAYGLTAQGPAVAHHYGAGHSYDVTAYDRDNARDIITD